MNKFIFINEIRLNYIEAGNSEDSTPQLRNRVRFYIIKKPTLKK